VAVAVFLAASCASSRPTSSHPPTSHSSVARPTVFNCGGGAFEPARLIVVCGVASTMATSVKWTAWGSTVATGSGLLHLQSSSVPAKLVLSEPVDTPQGPQFSKLTVTYTGASPDGHASDQFRLAVASPSNP
jgi:hypothetical protein